MLNRPSTDYNQGSSSATSNSGPAGSRALRNRESGTHGMSPVKANSMMNSGGWTEEEPQ